MRRFIVFLALATVAAAPPTRSALVPRPVQGKHSSHVTALAFSPDSKTLATGSRTEAPRSKDFRREFERNYRTEVKLWDVTTGKLRSTPEAADGNLAALGFFPDGKKLLYVSTDHLCGYWEVESGKVKMIPAKPPAVWFGDVWFSEDGKQAGACAGDGAVIWDIASGKTLYHVPLKVRATACVLDPAGKRLLAANHQDVDTWDIRSGKLVGSLLDHPGRVRALAISKDGSTLAACSKRDLGPGRRTGEAWLWQVAHERTKRKIHLTGLDCHAASLSPDGALLAVSGYVDWFKRCELRVFDVETGGELARLSFEDRERAMLRLAFSPDGKLLAAGCADDVVRLWLVAR
jgi:WD40 repeat protein